MSCICIFKESAFQVQDTYPRSYEQSCVITVAKQSVDCGEHLPRFLTHLGVVLYQCLCNNHEQSRRHSFTRDIRHNEGQMLFIRHEEIVKVAANLLGRSHRGIYIKLVVIRKGRENTWQHMCLNIRCQSKLCSDSFFFSCYFLKFFNIFSYLMVHFRK